MGTEFLQESEWNYEGELQWGLLKQTQNQKAQAFFRSLNRFYRETRPLWEIDFSWEGFSWIANDDYTQSVIAFRRMDSMGGEVLAVCNFQPVERQNYRIGAPYAGVYTEIVSTEEAAFGGTGTKTCEMLHSDPGTDARAGTEHFADAAAAFRRVSHLSARSVRTAKKTEQTGHSG